jgi:hypothetical protein
MGNLFPIVQLQNRFGIRESDNALLLGGGAALIPGGAEITMPTVAGTMANLISGNLLTSTNVGAVTTAATTAATEFGTGIEHMTYLTLTAFALGTAPDNASLAFGAKFYTLPAGALLVRSASLVGGVTAALSATNQTPECGIGTTVGVGAVATLSSTMEDIIDGGAAGIIGGANTAPDVAGTAFAKGTVAASSQGVYIAASGGKSHDLFLNVAAAWADVTAAGAATFTGTIVLNWRFM